MRSLKIFAMTVILATSFGAWAQATSISRAQIESFIGLVNETLALSPTAKYHIQLTKNESFSEPYSISIETKADQIEISLNLKKAATDNSIMAREAILNTLIIVSGAMNRSAQAFAAQMLGMTMPTAEELQKFEANVKEMERQDKALADAALKLGFSIPEHVRTSPFKMAELFADAQAGSLVARNHLLEIQYQNAKRIFANLTNPTHVPKDLDPALKGYAQLRNLPTEQIHSFDDLTKLYIESIDRELTKSRALAKKEERNREKAFRQPEATAARDAVRKTVKLDELIKSNDRKGTANLLEAMLPWQLMEPAEKIAWKNWIEAIRNPSNQTIKLYRGLDKYDRPIGPADKPGFFSVMINRNQGSYSDRLRSFARARMTLGRSSQRFATAIEAPTLAEMFGNHASDPVMSPFLSFSTDLKALMPFAENGLIEVEIDRRRALPNLTSVFSSEMEFLVPLIVFPDEVRAHIHGPGAKEQAFMYIAQNANPAYALATNKEAAVFAYRFLSEITQKSTAAGSCKNVFGN